MQRNKLVQLVDCLKICVINQAATTTSTRNEVTQDRFIVEEYHFPVGRQNPFGKEQMNSTNHHRQRFELVTVPVVKEGGKTRETTAP